MEKLLDANNFEEKFMVNLLVLLRNKYHCVQSGNAKLQSIFAWI